MCKCSGDTGTSSVLVGGLLLGGLVAGTLGYMYAPEVLLDYLTLYILLKPNLFGVGCLCFLINLCDLKYDLFGGRPNSASVFVDSFVLGVLDVCVSIRFDLSKVVYMFFNTLMLLILFLSL